LTARAQEGNPIGSLLMDIMFLFLRDDQQRLFTRDIVAGLNWKLDRPWAELRRGKKLSDVWLSQQLRPYGVRPRTLRIGEEVGKGYAMEDLVEVFQRYVPRSEYESFKAELKERVDVQRELEKPRSQESSDQYSVISDR